MSNLNVSGSDYTIEKGSNLWNVAKNICKKTDTEVSNADIVKEMTKLAKLNGCKTYDELGEKFNKIGNHIKLKASTNPVKATTKQISPHVAVDAVPHSKTHTNVKNKKDSSKRLKVNPFVAKLDTPKIATVAETTGIYLKTVLLPLLSPKVQGEMAKINKLSNDSAKVIEYNKLHPTTNYIIVNKQKSTATIYSPDGKTIKSIEVGTGQHVGDSLNDGYGRKGKANKTTPAGEFKLNARGGCGYGKNIFKLGSNYMVPGSGTTLALHIVPTHLEKQRLPLFGNGNVKDNRMSAGCINMKQKDFDMLTKDVLLGAKVYILPEEKGNSLNLNANKKGELKFVQTKYKAQA